MAGTYRRWLMKLFIIVSIALMCISSIVADDEVDTQPLFHATTPDTCISGYYLSPIFINPFAQCYEVKFNLPESSFVSIFITDLSSVDTVWYAHQESLAPGYYWILNEILMEKRDTFKGKPTILHFQAEGVSRSSMSSDLHCRFVAAGRL